MQPLPSQRSDASTGNTSAATSGAPSGRGRKRKCCLKSLTDRSSPPRELLDGKTQREQDLIKENWVSIKNYSHGCRVQSVYNLRIIGADDTDQRLYDIFSAQSTAFKINASVGLSLRNTKTNELRYFHGSVNNHRLFRSPYLVQNREEFRIFTDALEQADFSENEVQ